MTNARLHQLKRRYAKDRRFRDAVNDFVVATGLTLPEPRDVGKFPGLEQELELARVLRLEQPPSMAASA